MLESEYLKFSREEVNDLFFITIVLAFLFTFSNSLYSDLNENFVSIFFVFWIFIAIVLSLRLFFMKFVGYQNAFEIKLKATYFDRFWIRKWDRLSSPNFLTNKFSTFNYHNMKFPMYFFSVILFVFSLGILIYPAVWNYKIKKISHLHFGTRQKFEYKMGHMYNIEISDYRYSKALFFGFLYYFIVALILKFFFENNPLYFWLQFIVFWTSFTTLMPIFGSEGYELFRRNHFAWISVFTILVLGFLSIIIFNSFNYIFGATIISSFIILVYLLWRYLV